MKYLNLGCGTQYLVDNNWINLDFISNNKNIVGCNLLNGIPFNDNTFDIVYHSHLLEHFNKKDGMEFIAECYRVLKPGGVIRIAVPNLEEIVKEYLYYLNQVLIYPLDNIMVANYEWMKLEMYDQVVRNYSGGEMGKYLCQEVIENENFVFNRIGQEGKTIRKISLDNVKIKNEKTISNKFKVNYKYLITSCKNKIKTYLLSKLRLDKDIIELGKFRMGGEIHQWMYDQYSLGKLLKDNGFKNVEVRNAFTSFINSWDNFNLDGENGIVRKPDSLFMEAIK